MKILRSLIYALKRRYGQRVDYLVFAESEIDPANGSVIRHEDLQVIDRAVVLSGKEVREYEYDLSFIAANKNFTYGGLFDIQNRLVLVQKRDFRVGYSPQIEDRMVFNDANWEIKNFEENQEFIAFLVTKLRGSPVNEF